MRIRDYRDSDLDAIKAITITAFDGVSIDHNIERAFGLVAGHDWRWRKARHIDDDVAAPGAALFVAEDDCGQVVGYISTRFDIETRVGYIPNLSVRGDVRGHGIGRRLIEHAIAHFRSVGAALVRIETLGQNAIGQHLYPSCGFQIVAEQTHFAMSLDAGNVSMRPTPRDAAM